MRLPRVLLSALVALIVLPGLSFGTEVRGILASIAGISQSIEILDSSTGRPTVVTLTPQTVFVNAKSLRDFAVNDIVLVEMDAGQRATKLTRAVVPIGPEEIFGTDDVTALIAGTVPYLLVDARPQAAFDEGHIPTAVSIYVEDLARSWDRLPADKDRLLVFYCTGST